MKVKSKSEVAQSCLTPSNPMDYSLPGSSVHGIFQAGVLEWGAIAFSWGHALLLLLLSRFSHVDSVRPHRRQPSSLPHPWDSLGKNTGVGCHFLLQSMKVKSKSEVAQSATPCTVPWLLRPWNFPGKGTGVGAIASSDK